MGDDGMFGARLTIMTMASAALLVTGAAHAADYTPPPPQIYYQPPPPVVESYADGWYLRGDVGVCMMSANRL